jgi:hypothetical protein
MTALKRAPTEQREALTAAIKKLYPEQPATNGDES